MKNLKYFLFTLIVLAMATATQAQNIVKATIPFDFVVGNQTYAAGEYTMKSLEGNRALLRIDNTQEGNATMVLSNACEQLVPSEKTELVFHRVGDNYFLSQIWIAGNSSGREFPVSRKETQISQNRERPEMVIVAANISR
jgi:hypothetical protein